MKQATAIFLLLATHLYCACAVEEDPVMGEESVSSDSGGGVGGGGVELLHDYNFMETVKSAHFIVVEFYAPWYVIYYYVQCKVGGVTKSGRGLIRGGVEQLHIS